MVRIKEPAEIVESLKSRAVGETVTGGQVFGPNSLKTLTGPSDLVGDTLREASSTGAVVTLTFDRHVVTVDLQRIGAFVWLKDAKPWTIGDGTAMPTLRVLLGSTGFDFTESSKTKRIAVWIRDLGEPDVGPAS